MSNESRPILTTGYVADFDVIRGAAILLVMIYHTLPSVVRGGFIGVDIFFVLSGFLITRSMNIEVNRSGQNVNLRNFYIRRLLRLAPALILLVTLHGVYDLSQPYFLRTPWQEYVFALTYVSNWVRAFGSYPMDHFGHTWSLSIEEQFYLVWPLTFFLIIRNAPFQSALHKLNNVLVAFVMIVTLNRVGLTYNDVSIMRLYNGFDTRADGLIIGSLLGLYFNNQRFVSSLESLGRRTSRILIWIIPVLIFCLALRSDFESHKMYYWGYTLVSILTVVMLAIVNHVNSITRVCVFGKVSAPIAYIGRISYGLYLFHFPVSRILAVHYGFSSYKLAFLVVLLSTLIASISYYFVEMPCLSLKHRHLSV